MTESTRTYSTDLDSRGYNDMLSAATRWFSKSVSDINALNVFPVPDGDTGTNMLLTLQASLAEVNGAADKDVAAVASAMSRGALMGARGNSGVILSQILQGISTAMSGHDHLDGFTWVQALLSATKTAYQALSDPVEGTILTVIKEAANAANQRYDGGFVDLLEVWEAALDGARQAVADTPKQLRVLEESGVVDAGGQGLYTLLEGAYLYLRNDTDMMTSEKSEMIESSIPLVRNVQLSSEADSSFGYCTNFMVRGCRFSRDELRNLLESQGGESLIVIGDDITLRVHIHTQNPEEILDAVKALGEVTDVTIQDMDEQHEKFLVLNEHIAEQSKLATIAVVAGEGLVDLCSDLGATAVVRGGQTMNPSIMDILEAVESVPANNIIILPNNKNVVLAAQQVKQLTEKNVSVIPTRSVAQGMSALVALNLSDTIEKNQEHMVNVISKVKTLEITHSVRETQLNGLDIKEGQCIGILDDDLIWAGEDLTDCLQHAKVRELFNSAIIATIYFGADASADAAAALAQIMAQNHADLEVDVVHGGQPNYPYIISIEMQ